MRPESDPPHATSLETLRREVPHSRVDPPFAVPQRPPAVRSGVDAENRARSYGCHDRLEQCPLSAHFASSILIPALIPTILVLYYQLLIYFFYIVDQE